MRSLQLYCLTVVFYLTGTWVLFSQGNRCASIQPFCSGTTEYIFPNSNPGNSNVPFAESGPDYSCLDNQSYPAWFYLQIGSSGTLNFEISQNVNPDGSGGTLDVDFIAWGPFAEGDNLCSNASLSSRNIVGCSYSIEATENFNINNAREGEIYVVMITNFSLKPGFISLQQTNISDPNAGTTDCSIVSILGDDQKICGENSVKLVAKNVIANSFEWYIFDDALNDFKIIPNQSSANLNVTEAGRYEIIVAGTGITDEVLIEFFDLPEAVKPLDLVGCSNETSAIFDLTIVENELTQNYADSLDTFKIDYYESRVNFENGIAIENPIAFEGMDQQEILATITNQTSGCTSLPVSFKLLIQPVPVIILNETTILCFDLNGNIMAPVSLGQDLGAGYTYNWTPANDPDGDGVQNPNFIINEVPGESNISVLISNKISGCSSAFSTEIKVYAAPQGVSVQISGNDFDVGYVVTGTALGGMGEEATYEYRLDDGSWQLSASFASVPGGNHTISAREINGCGSAISQPFRLIGYPRFFTPNSDGYNDTWNVINDAEISITKVFIFDRYGKLLKQLDPTAGGWDGTYNSQVMPADDYWFLLEFQDADSEIQKRFKGHFTLKR
jgi:gliding motility-associated-like protein